jgi:[ribosomal protein S5]-alanine N-acetyltransferase
MIQALQTSRFYLAPLSHSDYDLYHSLYSSEQVTQHMGGALGTNKITRSFASSVEHNKNVFNRFTWRIQQKTDHQDVGLSALVADKNTTKTASIGTMLLPHFHRQGIATIVLSLIIDYAFTELKLAQLTGCSYCSNHISKKLMTSLGFDYTTTTLNNQAAYNWQLKNSDYK